MAGAGAVVVAMAGAALQNQSSEVTGGAVLLHPVLAHQILTAQQQRNHLFLHALVKRREMDGADLHVGCLVGMVGVGPHPAHQCLVQMMTMTVMMSLAVMGMEGA